MYDVWYYYPTISLINFGNWTNLCAIIPSKVPQPKDSRRDISLQKGLTASVFTLLCKLIIFRFLLIDYSTIFIEWLFYAFYWLNISLFLLIDYFTIFSDWLFYGFYWLILVWFIMRKVIMLFGQIQISLCIPQKLT